MLIMKLLRVIINVNSPFSDMLLSAGVRPELTEIRFSLCNRIKSRFVFHIPRVFFKNSFMMEETHLENVVLDWMHFIIDLESYLPFQVSLIDHLIVVFIVDVVLCVSTAMSQNRVVLE